MLDAQTQINAILGSANLSAADVTEAAQTVDQLSNVIASGNLAGADLVSALSAGSSDVLDDITREFKAAQGRVRSNLDLLPDNQGDQGPAGGRGKAARLRPGQEQRVQYPPEGTRRGRLRPDRP